MTAELLAEIQQRADKATQGPWIGLSDEICVAIEQNRGLRYPVVASNVADRKKWFKRKDTEFIAASRQDIPDLLAYVRELSEKVRDLNAILKDVLSESVSTIYFNDRSDYLSALWTITRKIDPQAAELLEHDESAAIEKYTDLIIKEEPENERT